MIKNARADCRGRFCFVAHSNWDRLIGLPIAWAYPIWVNREPLDVGSQGKIEAVVEARQHARGCCLKRNRRVAQLVRVLP